jgi:hypothetical protein
MPVDRNGKEPGQHGYTFGGMDAKKKAQAQAILIRMHGGDKKKAGKRPNPFAKGK